MPKGNLSYNSYTACVRDARANGVSGKNCAGLKNDSTRSNKSPNMGPNQQGSIYAPPQVPGFNHPGIGPPSQQPVETGWSGMNNPGGGGWGPWIPGSAGNNMPQPQARSIKGYGGGGGITPQPDPRLAGNNQVMSGQGNMRRRKPGQNLPVQPGNRNRRNPGQNQVMSGQGPANMGPRNVVGPPAQAGPRPLSKRRRRPRPNPGPMPSNFKGHY